MTYDSYGHAVASEEFGRNRISPAVIPTCRWCIWRAHTRGHCLTRLRPLACLHTSVHAQAASSVGGTW
ncbi:hypothetical protein PYCCODRAFT_543946 [Trametes coccinea BRFM310]|uniref:Uncharacterized protein n=1 Tax=Trametes coccinea (strain BRFM310) TaxID=1353009 RepID=A0A1Y2IJR3_TRAC3|nr:hypothetical protein PYCCODRAFT_543946 [Trametes coccinea BRFM310]